MDRSRYYRLGWEEGEGSSGAEMTPWMAYRRLQLRCLDPTPFDVEQYLLGYRHGFRRDSRLLRRYAEMDCWDMLTTLKGLSRAYRRRGETSLAMRVEATLAKLMPNL